MMSPLLSESSLAAAPARASRTRAAGRFRIAAGCLGVFLLGLAAIPPAQAQSSFGLVAVGTTTPVTQLVTVPVSVSGVKVASVAVLTMGSPKLDFTAAAGGTDTCTGQTFTAPASCTFSVSFTPLYPGPRNGAVVLEDGSGDSLGTAYISGTGEGSLAVMIPGAISILAGQVGEWNTVNDGQPATAADLYLPTSVALDGAGDVFIADSSHNLIREVIASTGIIESVAGNGKTGYDPTATVALDTTLTSPGGVALDGAGNLYISDTANNDVLEVNLASGGIVARWGNGQSGFAGDGQAPNDSTTEFDSPNGITVDAAGDIFIADSGNNRIREISAATGLITTFAGGGANPSTCSGSTDSIGDGCAATSATFSAPWSVALDPNGNLYVADSGDNRVRQINVSGVISTYAGDGAEGYTGDGSAAASAELYSPQGVACDAAGNVYIADTRNYVVRKVNAGTGIISTIAGNNNSDTYNDGKSGYTYGDKLSGEQFTGGGIANSGPSPMLTGAGIYAPYAVAIDPSGNLYIAEYFDNLVRKVTANSAILFFTPQIWLNQTTASAQTQAIENDGNAVLTFNAIGLPTDANTQLGNGTCKTTGYTLAVDKQCTISTYFYGGTASAAAPGTNPPQYTVPVIGTVSVTSNQVDSPLEIQAVEQVLPLDAVTVNLAGTPNPSAYNQAVNFAVSLKYSGSMPTGTVTLQQVSSCGSGYSVLATLGTGTLSGAATSFSVSTLPVGTNYVLASYGGNTYYQAANACVQQQVTEQVDVTVTNLGGNNPATYNTPVTFTANVSITGNVPFGSGTSVSFYDGATFLGSGLLGSGGAATFTTSALAPGKHSITATYTDTNNVTGTSKPYSQSVQQATSTVVTSTAVGNQSTYGASVTFTATVTATGPDVPGGTVTFYDGATKLATVNVSPGAGTTATAPYSTSTLAPGNHTITATYSGDTNDFSSTSAGYSLTVNTTSTTLTLAANPTSSIAGMPVTFTARLSGSAGSISGETVSFYNGSTLLGSAKLTSAGVAAWTTSALAVGGYSIIAEYAGDSDNGASSSSALSFSVVQAATSVKLQASATSVTLSTPVTFTATLTGNGGTPTGSVTFKDGGTTLGTPQALVNGVATLTTSSLPIGQQSITAVYAGDADDAGSTSAAVVVTVGTFSTQTNLAASATTVNSNQPVALLATVISASGHAVAGGTVTFFNGKTSIGTANIASDGSASLTITLTAGSDTVTAQYSGDTDDAASTSNAVTIKVGQVTDFSIQLNPTSVSIPTGNYANVKVSLASLDGFADDVALGCSSLPASVTCNFSTTDAALSSNGSAAVQLTVDTNSPLVSGSEARNQIPGAPGSSSGGILAAFLLPGAGLLSLWRFRRRAGLLKMLGILAVVGGAILAMNGCGGISLSSAKAGTYVIQVTATGTKTNVTHVADLTVQVTQ